MIYPHNFERRKGDTARPALMAGLRQRSIDGSRSDRVLQHMLDPERAFNELMRVTRPGGRVVVIAGDWATLKIDSDEPDTESRQTYFQETLRVANPLSGRCLQRLFERHGLLNIEIDVQPVFEPDADADGRFVSASVVIVSGRKAHGHL